MSHDDPVPDSNTHPNREAEKRQLHDWQWNGEMNASDQAPTSVAHRERKTLLCPQCDKSEVEPWSVIGTGERSAPGRLMRSRSCTIRPGSDVATRSRQSVRARRLFIDKA